MEMFNVHRRDIMNFDNYMNLKKPGFGGPSSAKLFKDGSGKRVNQDPRLKEYQRVVERDPMFSHPHYNSTYKAVTNDLVYKQEKKKPVTYADPYHTGLPMVNVAESANSGLSHSSFESFINEMYDEDYGANPGMGGETRVPCRNEDKAEDILLDMKIDWDGWDEAPVGTGKSFTKDGDIVAYFDDSVRPHELVILPEAEMMSDEEHSRILGHEEREEELEDELEDEMEDEYFRGEEEEEAATDDELTSSRAESPRSTDVSNIERMLKSFEVEDEEEYED